MSAFCGLKGSGINDDEYGKWVNANIDQFDDVEQFTAWLEVPTNRRVALGWLHFWPQYKWITVDGELRVDKLLRFESLHEDWPEFAKEYGFSGELEFIGRSHRKITLSDRSKKVIRTMYAKDFELFGYE